MTIKKDVYSQGDVFLVPTKIPTKATEEPEKNPTLAYGEFTGHSHRVIEGDARMFRFNDKTYLKVISKFAKLAHGKIEKRDDGFEVLSGGETPHNCLSIPEGEYEIGIQTNYTPSGWTKVID